MSSYGLVLNLGLKSIRAIAFDSAARKIASAARPIQTFLKDTWIEQDAEEWWSKAIISVKEVMAGMNQPPAFITVCASAACLVCVDDEGRPLRRAIMVSDRRAFAEADRMARAASFPAVHAVNRSFVADPYFMLPKALWVQQHEPEVYASTHWLMSPGDFLVYRLTGNAVTDALNAEKFFFDPTKGTYPSDLFEELGVSPAKLLPVASLGCQVGEMRSTVAASMGIGSDVPIILSTYDAISAFWGSGVCQEGDVADVSGTVTSVRVLSAKPIGSDDKRVFTQSMPGTQWFAVGGSNNLGGGLIEWLKQSFYGGIENPYELMEEEAHSSGPSGRGILFLPYLLGERCPIWDPRARGVFFGLERQHQRGDFSRAVLESAAYTVEHILQVLREQGLALKRLRVSGGLARIRLVSIIKADVSGLPVDVLEEFETASLGAFLLAGCGVGLFPNLDDASQLVRVTETISPRADRSAQYAPWFAMYRKLYDTLQPLFHERHDLFVAQQLGGAERLENL
jgi:sugar (pentulose or hexulose) kinase